MMGSGDVVVQMLEVLTVLRSGCVIGVCDRGLRSINDEIAPEK